MPHVYQLNDKIALLPHPPPPLQIGEGMKTALWVGCRDTIYHVLFPSPH